MEGLSRRERSERCDSDVHRARVYWLIGVFKFAERRLYCGGAGAYGTGSIGAFLVMSVRNPYNSVQSLYGSVRPKDLGFYSFPIYISLM